MFKKILKYLTCFSLLVVNCFSCVGCDKKTEKESKAEITRAESVQTLRNLIFYPEIFTTTLSAHQRALEDKITEGTATEEETSHAEIMETINANIDKVIDFSNAFFKMNTSLIIYEKLGEADHLTVVDNFYTYNDGTVELVLYKFNGKYNLIKTDLTDQDPATDGVQIGTPQKVSILIGDNLSSARWTFIENETEVGFIEINKSFLNFTVSIYFKQTSQHIKLRFEAKTVSGVGSEVVFYKFIKSSETYGTPDTVLGKNIINYGDGEGACSYQKESD